MASDRLVKFAALVNAGTPEGQAALTAGFALATAKTKLGMLRRQARDAGLLMTIAEATAPLDAIRAAVKLEDWTAITVKAVELAIEGDAVAREWLSNRIIGKVPQPIDSAGEFILTIRRGDDVASADD